MEISRSAAHRTRRPARIGAVLLAAAVLLAGCGSTPPGDAGRIDAKLVADLRPGDAPELGRSVNAFGFDLFARLADGRRNTVTSPLSVSVMLAMVLAGARGDTASELAAALHLDDPRDVRTGALLRTLADTDQVTLSVADALWADADTPLEKEYQDFVRRTFGATVQRDDLGSERTARAIDAWAARNTGGRIRTIAADLGLPNRAAELVLLNAVYFLGRWKTPFDPHVTRPQPFTLAGGGRVEVPTMHLYEADLGYTQRTGYRMLRLPYGKDGRYGMEILLPDEGTTLAKLLGSLDADEWRAAVGSLATRTVQEVALPRFELTWKATLNDALRGLGAGAAFAPGEADFGPMTPRGIRLDRVVHKTYIRVDEQGTEAAAVTGGMMMSAAPPDAVTFRVDRPFAFTISDRTTGTILFLGAVADPTAA